MSSLAFNSITMSRLLRDTASRSSTSRPTPESAGTCPISDPVIEALYGQMDVLARLQLDHHEPAAPGHGQQIEHVTSHTRKRWNLSDLGSSNRGLVRANGCPRSPSTRSP